MTELTGAWSGWRITDSTIISPSGREYKPSDIEPVFYTQSDLARALGVTRGAVADRIRRGTLPPYDDPDKKTWHRDTIKYLFKERIRMRVWEREGYTVVEKEYDRDLHEFDVVKGGEVVATITPADLNDMARIVEDLDNGADVNGWEDGMGNTISV